jgi:hypothetical protein
MERIALRGCSLEVDVRPAEGTTMTLRLAAAIEERKDRPEPAKAATSSPSTGSNAPQPLAGLGAARLR